MNYYKLEKIQYTLKVDFGAARVSTGPKPRTEVWGLTVGNESKIVALAWEHGEELLSEEELLMVAEALAIDPTRLLRTIKDRGGLWLGPTPPSRK